MIDVYLNYPNSCVSVHGQPTCPAIGQMRKAGQRRVRVDPGTRETELRKFTATYRFASKAEFNDMWVSVDLDTRQEEASVVAEIKKLLGRRYRPFREAAVERHC